MQYEITFNGGPKHGEKTIYGQAGARGQLYSVKYDTDGMWHYYVLCTRGSAHVPNHYEFLGSTQAVLDSVDSAREYFASIATT